MATVERPREKREVAVKEMIHHPHRRVAGDPHGDRLREPGGAEVLQHVDGLPGFDIFMKGIDSRDAHFITSRICGICA